MLWKNIFRYTELCQDAQEKLIRCAIPGVEVLTAFLLKSSSTDEMIETPKSKSSAVVSLEARPMHLGELVSRARNFCQLTTEQHMDEIRTGKVTPRMDVSIYPSYSPLQQSEYYRFDGVLDPAWRARDCVWELTTEVELARALRCVRKMKARDELEKWARECLRRTEGAGFTTWIVGKKHFANKGVDKIFEHLYSPSRFVRVSQKQHIDDCHRGVENTYSNS